MILKSFMESLFFRVVLFFHFSSGQFIIYYYFYFPFVVFDFFLCFCYSLCLRSQMDSNFACFLSKNFGWNSFTPSIFFWTKLSFFLFFLLPFLLSSLNSVSTKKPIFRILKKGRSQKQKNKGDNKEEEKKQNLWVLFQKKKLKLWK